MAPSRRHRVLVPRQREGGTGDPGRLVLLPVAGDFLRSPVAPTRSTATWSEAPAPERCAERRRTLIRIEFQIGAE